VVRNNIVDGDTDSNDKSDLPLDDFNIFFHELRTRELRKAPPGAKTFLSGGCSGRWYFDWINQNYHGIIRHIGVEAYQSKPDNLPSGVEWVTNTLGNMNKIKSGEIEMVFAGQTIEHLWADDLVSFLCESHRVLKNDGIIVLDSPNRRVTYGTGWFQPQHTMELTVEEIIELLTLAGFTDLNIRGVWLCYDRKNHCFLPLDPRSSVCGWDYKKRISMSSDNPEDCFSWWVEGKKSNISPDPIKLQLYLADIYEQGWKYRLSRLYHNVGTLTIKNGKKMINTNRKDTGAMIYGPYIPLRPGKYTVMYSVSSLENAKETNDIICNMDVYAYEGSRIIASRVVRYDEIKPNIMNRIYLPFELARTEFGIEFRMFSTGNVGLSALFQVELKENAD